jgi:hypothetical protein
MTELILAGDEQQNVPAVLEIAHGLGYTATTPTPGRIKLERGSVGMTIAFGGLAGKKFHISFTFDIGVDEHRNTWLRFDQDGAMGAVKGGAIGYAKSKAAFTEFVDAVRRSGAQRGILLGER